MTEPLLYDVLFAWKCTSTHHKLALDALRHLQHERAEAWRNLFLAHVELYLDGSKAPDNKFKDFRNHVLHVEENLWGGAVGSTIAWYAKSLESLKAKRWKEAIYNAGVLSHYFTDPWQPFHTGQSEAEGIVHRAAEWSIACAYQELQTILEEDQGGYPEVKVPVGDDWLSQMVIQGARTSHPHYQPCIDHYDVHKGVKDPPTGLDQELKDRLAKLIGLTVVSLSRVFDRLFTEAEVAPPGANVSLLGVLSQMTIPLFWVTRKMKNAKDRAAVEAVYREFQATGKVIQALPADDKEVRKLYAEEVLQLPLEMLDEEKPGPVGQAHGTGAPARTKTSPVVESPVSEPPAAEPAVAKRPPLPKQPAAEPPTSESLTSEAKFYLDETMPVEKAPSIGPKIAGMLERVGVKTVADLLDADPDELAVKLANRHYDADVLAEWQQQAQLVCEVPELRGGDAQLLTGCGVGDAEELGRQNTDELFTAVKLFAGKADGVRILRGGKPPLKEEVAGWITRAQQRRAA